MPLLDHPDTLAAVGVLRRLGGQGGTPASTADEALSRIRRAVARGTVCVDLDLDAGALRAAVDPARDALGDAWRRGADAFQNSGRRRGLRVQIDGLGAQPDAVYRCVQDARGVDAITVMDRSTRGPWRWDWPLTVLALGDEIHAAVASYGHPDLLRLTDTLRDGADLLIAGSPDALSSAARRGDTAAGLVLAFVDSRDAVRAARSGGFDTAVPRRATAVVRRPADVQAFVHLFLDELAHDHPPDVAVAHAVSARDDYTVIGDTGFLDRARVSLVLERFEGALERALARKLIDVGLFAASLSGLRDLHMSGAGFWEHEGGAATFGIDVTRDAREAIAKRMRTPEARAAARPDDDAAPSRHLQAQVYARGVVDWERRARSFEPAARHRIDVRIGASDLDWIQVPEEFPDKTLPPEEARLTVHLVAPAVLARPEAREIYLRETGASTVARFEFDVPASLTEVQATAIVYHEGRHLQTAVLEGDVAAGDADGHAIRFRRGAASQAELAHQRECDLVIWKDRERGELQFTLHDPDAAPDDPSNRVIEPSLAGVEAVLDGIRDALFAAAARFDQLDGTLEDDGLDLIRGLAEQGEYLRRTLFGDAPRDIRRVQFVSPYSADSFPVEFLYDHALPDVDAQLCPGFKATPGVGCDDCHAERFGARYVCPSGFWGLNRIIERQVRPADASCRQPESSERYPGPLPMDSIVFAAADEVNDGDPQRVQRTLAELGKLAAVHPASTWSSWKDGVTRHYPALLVALPHNVEHRVFQRLRIAADQDLAFNRITPEHVAPKGAGIGTPVLLFACNSANAPVEYQDFVKQFRCNGAPLVVATITYVLGPQAARVAREFASQLWARRGDASAGEILLQVRNSMLKQDNLMALALAAYGDADWRI